MAAVLSTGSLLAAAPIAAAAPSDYIVQERTSGVTADALPTTQIDGVAWDQEIVGNTVYAGGEFTNARPAGAAAGVNTTPRSNLLSYNLTTGDLNQGFKQDTNGSVNVLAASPDGSRLYVGGSFTTVGGQNRYRLAAINTADGSLVPGFAPTLDAAVYSLAVTNDAVYVGGGFSRANNQARQRLAAFDPKTGALLPWAPTANRIVRAMTMSPDNSRIIVGGLFSYINGSYAPGSASIDTNGTLYPFAMNRTITNGTANTGIFSLQSAGSDVLGTAYNYGEGKYEGIVRADAMTGGIKWLADCHGDSYDATQVGDVVYSVSHHHNCENIGSFPQIDDVTFQRANAFTAEATGTVRTNRQYGYTNFGGNPAPSQVNWFPDLAAGSYTGQAQAAWTAEGNDQYLVLGGEFPKVNGKAQQGLVRFAVPSVSGAKSGAVVGGAYLKPTATVSGTTATLKWTSSWDYDNKNLSYQIYRSDNPTTPIDTIKADSLWWDRPSLSWTDSTMEAGKSYDYWLFAVDADGNRVRSDNVSVTAGQPVASDAYLGAVLKDQPSHLWRLGEPSGSTSADVVGNNTLHLGTGVYRNDPGILSGDASSWFSGYSSSWGTTAGAEAAPASYTSEAWVKTTTTTGGVILNQGSAQTGLSSITDREVYMTNTGQIAYSVYSNGARRAIVSSSRYNDGRWHHIATTLSSEGMKLFVDGNLVARNSLYTTGTTRTAYWRVGGDAQYNLAYAPTSSQIRATIDEVAIYPTALTADQIRIHAGKGGISVPNTAPVAAFTSTCADAVCTFDASASKDADGSIAKYEWTFGDGSTGTGRTAQHAYAEAGTYQVKLTVTDDKGTTHSITKSVEVTVPAPVVTDPVTDPGTDPVTDPGTDPVAATLAKDTFTGTRTRWGSADQGGSWTYPVGASSFSTVDGAGRMTLGAGATAGASLADVSAQDVVVSSDVTIDKQTTGGGVNVFLAARRTTAGEYRVKLRLLSNGSANLAISRVLNGQETVLREVVAAEQYTPGQVVHLQLEVNGTTVSGKAWGANETEPATPTVTVTDTTAALQTAGAVGVLGYASGSATNAPFAVSFDNFTATRQG